MPTAAVGSHGALLKIGNGAQSETFTTIGEVKDISGPSTTLNTEDVTSHDSGGWTEFIGTTKDGGEVTFDINYFSAATQDQLETDLANATRRNFQLERPLSGGLKDTRSFAAYVTAFEPSSPVSGVLTASVTLRTTGQVSKAVT